jgi:hypothetical protein
MSRKLLRNATITKSNLSKSYLKIPRYQLGAMISADELPIVYYSTSFWRYAVSTTAKVFGIRTFLNLISLSLKT